MATDKELAKGYADRLRSGKATAENVAAEIRALVYVDTTTKISDARVGQIAEAVRAELLPPRPSASAVGGQVQVRKDGDNKEHLALMASIYALLNLPKK